MRFLSLIVKRTRGVNVTSTNINLKRFSKIP